MRPMEVMTTCKKCGNIFSTWDADDELCYRCVSEVTCRCGRRCVTELSYLAHMKLMDGAPGHGRSGDGTEEIIVKGESSVYRISIEAGDDNFSLKKDAHKWVFIEKSAAKEMAEFMLENCKDD